MISGRDSSATPGPETTAVPRAVDREALAGDLAAAGPDQGTADPDRGTPGEGQAAVDADRTASERDDQARRRERRALLVEEAIAGSDAPAAEKVERLRKQAAHDRAGAAEDRERAAEERTEATAERARLESGLDGAYLDGLTGAFRREVGRHALALEVDRARQADGRFVLACIDVDGLGGINERAGHATGDHVLRTLVAIMRSSLRSYDPIVRMGGDDFACGIAGAALDEVDLLFYEVERSLHADTGVGIRWARPPSPTAKRSSRSPPGPMLPCSTRGGCARPDDRLGSLLVPVLPPRASPGRCAFSGSRSGRTLGSRRGTPGATPATSERVDQLLFLGLLRVSWRSPRASWPLPWTCFALP